MNINFKILAVVASLLALSTCYLAIQLHSLEERNAALVRRTTELSDELTSLNVNYIKVENLYHQTRQREDDLNQALRRLKNPVAGS
jgi:cell division protein FtsB